MAESIDDPEELARRAGTDTPSAAVESRAAENSEIGAETAGEGGGAPPLRDADPRERPGIESVMEDDPADD